jgi:bla regulator protein blaR1
MPNSRQSFVVSAGMLVAAISVAGFAQSPNERTWEKAAGGKIAFEVASVRLNPGPPQPSNFRLSPDDAYANTGGLLNADSPLGNYIEFAYKIQPTREQWEAMYAHLPKWVTTANYEIHARAPMPNPTKDQMRLMMQSLLRERFALVVHYEERETPAFEMYLANPGKPGPQLRRHEDGPPCSVTAPPGAAVTGNAAPGGVILKGPDVFPATCGAVEARFESHQMMLMGGRDTTMDTIASYLSIGRLGRPIVNQTGLTGRYDFMLNWAPDPGTFRTGPPETASQDAAASEPPQGPSFLEAIQHELGLKLKPARVPLNTLVIDHVERPTKN